MKVSHSSDIKVNEDEEDEEDEEAMYKAEYDEKHYPIHTENDTDCWGGGKHRTQV